MTTEDTATRLLRELVTLSLPRDFDPHTAQWLNAHYRAWHYLLTLAAGSERADDVGELVEPGGDWYRVEVLLIRAQSPYYDSALCIEAALGIVKRHADAYRYSRPRYGAPGGPEPVAGWGGDGPIDGPIAHG